MRMTRLVGRTSRDVAADVVDAAQQLTLRAGVARPMLAGGMVLLPLGMQVLRRIEQIMHEELEQIEAQEFRTPMIQPASLWERSGRYAQYGPFMLRLTNRSEQPLLVAPTHEEAVTELGLREIDSYRQLPAIMYQIHTKYRDEQRVRGGLLRLREFTMLDAYSFAATHEQLDLQYTQLAQAFEQMFARVGVAFVRVEASTGDMGGSSSYEYMALTDSGEDRLVICEQCGYAANSEIAVAQIKDAWVGAAAELEEVHTPDCQTIAEVARLLQVPEYATAKAVFFTTPEHGLVFVVIRGDLQVSEDKLRAALGASQLNEATPEDIAAVGSVAGYASPVNISNAMVVADYSILGAGPLVAGANREAYHLRNVVYGRDWQADLVGDVHMVQAGEECRACGAALTIKRGVELGHIFKLDTRYSSAMGAMFVDAAGESHPLIMGSYGIGLERLMHIIVDQHHDAQGIIWPHEVAPWSVQLVRLGASAAVVEAAEVVYTALKAQGVKVLFDDRQESAGVKFTDADLIGLPWRIVVSERGLNQGTLEIRRRATAEMLHLAQAELEQWIATTFVH